MRVSILADSGPGVGLGHVGRCMGLSQGIESEYGTKPTFYVEDRGARAWIRQRGFPLGKRLPRLSDLLIVDSYRQSRNSLIHLWGRTKQLLMVDDLGHPFSRADWILNSAPLAKRLGYSKKLSERLLLGPQFHPLRREYWNQKVDRVTRHRVRRVLIILGGGDARLLFKRILRCVQMVVPKADCYFVVGPMSHMKFPVEDHVRTIVSPKNLRDLLEQCDVAITGAGQTLYELAFAGLPAVAVKMAPNQNHNVIAFEKSGTILSAGSPIASGFERRFVSCLRKLVTSKTLRARMAKAGQELVDGWGARRVARAVLVQGKG